MPKFFNLMMIVLETVSKVCRNMAIHISYLLACSFSVWHSSNNDVYGIPHKVLQDNAGYAFSLY